MNIWIVSLFDPTPIDEPIFPRFIEIAKAANKQGHYVKHFTSTFRHTKKQYRFTESQVKTISEKYEVVFTHSMSYKNNMSPTRFIAHRDYAKKLVKAFSFLEKPDVIFISMPPLSTIREVTKWGQNNKVPVVVDVIDPWPDSFIKDVPNSLKPLARVLIKPFYDKLKKSFRDAAAITAISNGYLEWAKNHHDSSKITKAFFLAIDVDEVKKVSDKVIKKKIGERPLRLIYAGSLASSYDIPSILKAAEIIEKTYPGKTEFVFTGKGPQLEMIKQYEEKYNNIEYLGWLSKEELLRQYALADIGLIQHKNSLTQTITYKFFNYMSAGLVLLNSLQTEMADMIKEFNLGLNNKEGDYKTLTDNIITYLKQPELLERQKSNVVAFTYEKGHTKNVYNSLVDFLTDIAKTNHEKTK
jgi:glycosyltransferase involved in cell wall biosynthesis